MKEEVNMQIINVNCIPREYNGKKISLRQIQIKILSSNMKK